MLSPSHPADSLVTKLELFVELSAEEKIQIRHVAGQKVSQIPSHEDIIREGETPDHVNLILSGWACRYKQLSDGRRQIIGFFLPGDLCDLRAVVPARMDHSISTITEVTLARIRRESVLDLVVGDAPLAHALRWSALVTEAIEREWILSLGQRTALERTGHLLCELFERLRAVGLSDDRSCNLPLTQVELAEATGLSTVHVNRTLQELRGLGLIVLRGKTLTLLDVERLRKMSHFSDHYLHMRV